MLNSEHSHQDGNELQPCSEEPCCSDLIQARKVMQNNDCCSSDDDHPIFTPQSTMYSFVDPNAPLQPDSTSLSRRKLKLTTVRNNALERLSNIDSMLNEAIVGRLQNIERLTDNVVQQQCGIGSISEQGSSTDAPTMTP